MQSLGSFHPIPLVLLSLALLFAYNPLGSAWLLFLYSLPAVAFLWIVTGGYRYLWVVYKTLPRDLIGLRFIIYVFYYMRKYSKNGDTIATLFEETAKKQSTKIAFVCEGLKWTFKDVSVYSNAVAHFLSNRCQESLQKGDVVSLFMETCPEYVGAWLGIVKRGGIAALINTNQRNEALLHSITVAESKAVIVGEDLLPAIKEISSKLNPSVPIFVVPKAEGSPSDFIKSHKTFTVEGLKCETMDLEKLEEFFPLGLYKPPKREFSDVILYIYTSGTTGLPKAAKIATSRFWYMATGPHMLPGLTSDDVVYVSLPIYHSNGGILGVGQALLRGCTVVFRKKFSASRFWDDCVEHNCTVFLYIGEICRYLLAQPKRESESQHHIKFAIGNGLREKIWPDFQNRFNIKHIVEFYGATEGNCNAINYCDRVGSVGFTSRIIPKAYPIFLIKVDETTGQPLRDESTGLCLVCEPGEPGELIGRIKQNNHLRRFDGYATKAETEKKIVKDVFFKGDMYFRSGDILEMDELGFFFFKDRTGDTFRWRGENVSTQEVEAMVSSVASLKDCAVYGVEVPGVEGRAGMAAIVDPEHELDITNGFAAELSKKLPSYGVPVFLRLMDKIPATGTYKFVKGDLQKQAFNPDSVGKDPLYFLDSTKQPRCYTPLTRGVYDDIIAGKIRL